MLVISTLFTVLLFGILIPVFHQYSAVKKVSKVLFFIGCMVLISAEMQSGFNIERKQPNSIFYVLDANKNEAFWASYNSQVDEFTQQFLGNNPIEGSYDKSNTSSKYNSKVKLHQKAFVKALQKPTIKIVTDTIVENDRQILLQILSVRNANKIELLTNIPVKFKSFIVNNEALKNKSESNNVLSVNKGTIMSYFRTSEEEMVNVQFTVAKDQHFDLEVLEIKYDLLTNTEFEIEPRTELMMPMPFVLNDATVIKTNLIF
jgi:hypothetical protein